MGNLVRSWAAAILIWIAGLALMARIVPNTAQGQDIAQYDQLVRIHIPWIIVSVGMTVGAGAFHRDRLPVARRLLALLLVPALATGAGSAAGLAGQTSAVATALYVGEGVLGAVAGLLLANLFSEREAASSYW
jgi:hypothetical protein